MKSRAYPSSGYDPRQWRRDTCFLCAFMHITYVGDWSDVTPGEGFVIACLKGHFRADNDEVDTFDWHGSITKSRTCDDFKANILR